MVSSHGVGGPGAMCLFQELATRRRHDPAPRHRRAIRPGIGDGDLVIAEAAVRDDGVNRSCCRRSTRVRCTGGGAGAAAGGAAAGARHHRASCGRGPRSSRASSTARRGLRGGRDRRDRDGTVGAAGAGVDARPGGRRGARRGRRQRRRPGRRGDAGGYDPDRMVVAEGVARGGRVTVGRLDLLATKYGATWSERSGGPSAGDGGDVLTVDAAGPSLRAARSPGTGGEILAGGPTRRCAPPTAPPRKSTPRGAWCSPG